MPRNFSRHEQFLRIFALLDILSNAHQLVDDQTLIAELKERLGLSRLSTRTLHRDCDFLITCGYPIDRTPISGDRRLAWQLRRRGDVGRKLLPEPLTLLELVAFKIGRELLRSLEGTILWTGIESLRFKLERELSEEMLKRLRDSDQVFLVEATDPSRYAGRPRLISTLSNAITDCREIEVVEQREIGGVAHHRLQPHQLLIKPPNVKLLSYPSGPPDGRPVIAIDIARIQKVTTLDSTFLRRSVEPEPE